MRLPNDQRERRGRARFPLALEVRYTVLDGRVPVHTGSGRIIDLSTSGLRFTSDRPLLVGMRVAVSIDWPFLHDLGVQVRLIASGVVVRSNGTETAYGIEHHEFTTHGSD